MKAVYTLSQKHMEQLHALYQQEWWSQGRSLEDTVKCIAGSQICIGILNREDDLVGFVRVLTDYTFKAILFDVIVEASHRKQGLGRQLVELVKSHEDLKRVKHFELYGLPDLQEFYARFGFTTEVDDIALMRCDSE